MCCCHSCSRGHIPSAHGELGTVDWLPTSLGAAQMLCLDCSSVSWLQATCNALSSLPGNVQTELNPELSPLCQRPSHSRLRPQQAQATAGSGHSRLRPQQAQATAGSATVDGAQPFYDSRCNASDVDAGQPHKRRSTVIGIGQHRDCCKTASAWASCTKMCNGWQKQPTVASCLAEARPAGMPLAYITGCRPLHQSCHWAPSGISEMSLILAARSGHAEPQVSSTRACWAPVHLKP